MKMLEDLNKENVRRIDCNYDNSTITLEIRDKNNQTHQAIFTIIKTKDNHLEEHHSEEKKTEFIKQLFEKQVDIIKAERIKDLKIKIEVSDLGELNIGILGLKRKISKDDEK